MKRAHVILAMVVGCAPLVSRPETATLVGFVIDPAGRPLAAARVMLLESGRTVETAEDGRFVISGLPPAEYTVAALAPECLVAVGVVPLFEPRPVGVELRLEQWAAEAFATRFSVIHDAAWTEGAATRVFTIDRSRAGSAGSVLDFLAREAPDVVQVSGGQPGGGASVRGRAASLRPESLVPLVIVDGVRIAGPRVTGAAGDPLREIPLSDVRRIEILRGSGASALYGSDGAAGAIRITTSGMTDPPTLVPVSFCPAAARVRR